MKKTGIVVKVYKSMTRDDKQLQILDSYSLIEVSNFWFKYIRCGVKDKKKLKFYSNARD